MSKERLLRLREDNDRAGAEMLIESARFSGILENKPRAVSAFNLFQTPRDIADIMALKFSSAYNVLEPSAGLGRLFWAMHYYYPQARYTLYENNPDCMSELYRQTSGISCDLKQCNFLQSEPRGEYDAVIMNPPFKQGLDIKHIRHARKHLAADGLLVALCFNGSRQNKFLKPECDTWEVLPEGSFKIEGTRASVALLTMSA